MPNIAITTYCNLHCPYCFANDMINTEKTKNITLEQFNRILRWIDDNDHIGIIGGEPTLHPQFDEILKLINQYSIDNPETSFTFYTNGVYIDKYIQDLPVNSSILLNVNQPQAMTKEQFDRMCKNIDTFSKMGWLNTPHCRGRVTLGCNICEEIDDYSFFFNLLSKYTVTEARVSVTAPTKEKDKKNKFGYYLKMKKKFLKFIDDCIRNRIFIHRDCNQIPECFFTQEEKNNINFVFEDPIEGFHCNPVIDITPDFMASSCFGAYELMDCSKFKKSSEMARYAMYKKMYPRVQNNGKGMCEGCPKHELMICQGGCLAFGES